jgi:hypothetical protein
MCQDSPHGEAIFATPMWPFITPVHVPAVSLHSTKIVQRHVNSLLLSRFLLSQAGDTLHLDCVAFFGSDDADSLADRFRVWLSGGCSDWAELERSIDTVVANSPLGGAGRQRLLDDGENTMLLIATRWRNERRWLEEELTGLDPVPRSSRTPKDPVRLAIERQLERLDGEYLLTRLAIEGFLPAHGFPLHVVPFVPTTIELLKAEANAFKAGEREDSFGRCRSYPSRHVAMAIREYAPGASVVIDGTVYESAGLTLNWHVPPGDTEMKEVQSITWAWRCRKCGAQGRPHGKPTSCDRCRASTIDLMHLIEPAGFAVDIRSRPSNRLDGQRFVPPREPWISAGRVDWQPLADATIGRVRYDSDGSIVHWSSGEHGHGYAVCLRCGRAASEVIADASVMPREMREHDRLRGGRSEDRTTRCRGNDGEFSIQRSLCLGGEQRTDVAEIEFRDPATGAPLVDEIQCTTLAVALRRALAEDLGVDTREIGWATRLMEPAGGVPSRTIVLFDSVDGGAGYVQLLAEQLSTLIGRARDRLRCPRDCDAACHGCLLEYDTQYAIERLDRKRGLDLLDDAFLARLALPPGLAVFGPASVLEGAALSDALRREIMRPDVASIRLFVAGDPNEWSVEEWSVWLDVVRASTRRVSAEIVLPRDLHERLPWDVANALASRLEAIGGRARVTGEGESRAGELHLAAEVASSTRVVRWAVVKAEGLIPGSTWGSAGATDRCVRGVLPIGAEPPRGREVTPESLRKTPPGHFRMVALSKAFAGPASRIGARFWQSLAGDVDGLGDRLRTRVVQRIAYRDRYVRSPLVSRLLYEVVRELASRNPAGRLPELSLVTTPPEFSQRSPRFIDEDWSDAAQQSAVLPRLFGSIAKPSIQILDRRDTQHHRVLTVTWDDGATLEVRLDQGFGCARASPRVPFDFRAPVERVCESLLRTSIDLMVAGGGETPTYVSGVQHPG